MKAAIYYEKNDFNKSKECLEGIGAPEIQNLVNLGCIMFKQEQHLEAIAKFKEAAKMYGFNSELYYNLALAHYEMKLFSEAHFYLDTIIRRAYELYPKLKLVSPESPLFEKDDKNLA